jgi:SAM-dependent MidA family methyltransferase
VTGITGGRRRSTPEDVPVDSPGATSAETWAQAMARCLHTTGSGFYRAERGPGTDFRTAATVAPDVLADALVAMWERLPVEFRRSVVEIGAGTGSVLAALAARLPVDVGIVGVEQRPRPAGLPARVGWRSTLPAGVHGLVIAFEWLDTVPVDVVLDGRLVRVGPTGVERPGPRPSPVDEAWLVRWWPAGGRREVGHRRDAAWVAAVSCLAAGVAVAVDYGHVRSDRPVGGSLIGYRRGRVAAAVPDGDRDVTAAVAWDAVAGAVAEHGPQFSVEHTVLTDQRSALRDLGVRAYLPARPPGTAPSGYAAELQRLSRARLLLDPNGLGSFSWLLHAVGVPASVLPGQRAVAGSLE